MNARWTLWFALTSALLGGCSAILGLHPPQDGGGAADSDADGLRDDASSDEASGDDASSDGASADEASGDDASGRAETAIDEPGEPPQADVATDAADVAIDVVDAAIHIGGGAPIVWHGTNTAMFPGGSDAGTAVFRLSAPVGARADDVFIAGLAFGSITANAPSGITVPAGWTLIARKDHLGYNTLVLYWARGAAVAAGVFDWSVAGVAGVAWLSAYGGVSAVKTIAATAGVDLADGGTIFVAPPLSAVSAGSVVIASFGGYTANNVGVTWSAPVLVRGAGGLGTPMTVRANLYNNGRRSAVTADALQGMAGSAGPFESITSTELADALGIAFSLAP